MTLDQYLEGVMENQRFMNERKDKTKHEVQFTEQLNLYVEWHQVPKFWIYIVFSNQNFLIHQILTWMLYMKYS
jgi:hypothetical protein